MFQLFPDKTDPYRFMSRALAATLSRAEDPREQINDDTITIYKTCTNDSERSDAARKRLNTAENPYVSVLNLMELRSVLSKKNRFERDRIDQIEARITTRTAVTFPDASDMMAANQLQSESLFFRLCRTDIAGGFAPGYTTPDS